MKIPRCSSSIFHSKQERDRKNYKRGKEERETTANSTKIKRKSGAPIFVQKESGRRTRGKKGGKKMEVRDEARGADRGRRGGCRRERRR